MKNRAPSLAAIDLTGLTILVVAGLATYFLGVTPAQRARASQESDRQALATRLEDMDAIEQQHKDAVASLAEVKALASSDASILRTSAELYTRIQRITEMAQGFTLSIAEINPGKEIVGKRSSRIPIRLSGAGSYGKFSAFLASLHAEFADLQVVSFKLTDRAEDQKALPRFEAELCWFVAADAGKAAPAAGSGLSTPAGSPQTSGRQLP